MQTNTNITLKYLTLWSGLAILSFHNSIYAADVLSVKTIGMELARDNCHCLSQARLSGKCCRR